MGTSNATDSPASDLALFLETLADEGRAVVGARPLGNETEGALAALQKLDTLARNEIALDTPLFSADAALWAARLLYHLCQFTVCRDIGEEQIVRICAVPCPERRAPEVDWSVDLTLRHLPKLFDFARHLSNADPLVLQMNQIATTWPLSSVGIPGLQNLEVNSFVGHPALRRLYVDRIIAANDASRLGDSRVKDLLRSDLGIHKELAPAIAEKLIQPLHDTH